MFYFLGLVLKNDVAKGNIVPTYTLHKRVTPKREGSKSEYIFQNVKTVEKAQTPKPTKDNCRFWGRPKVLVTTPYGHDYLVNIMSCVRDKYSKQQFPRGSLFWFPCDEYGKIKGAAIWIKNVPDRSAWNEHEKERKKDRSKDWLEELIKVNGTMPFTQQQGLSKGD